MAPAKFPPAAASRLNRELTEVLKRDDIRKLLADQGLIAEPGPPEALTAQIRGDIAKWRDVVPNAGITAE